LLVELFGHAFRLFFFEHHVAVFDGVEDLAAVLALDEFGVFVARDDANLWVFTLRGRGFERRNAKIFTRPGERVNRVLPEIRQGGFKLAIRQAQVSPSFAGGTVRAVA
jgi:hypothetical protein